MSPMEKAIPIIFNPPDNSENKYIQIFVSGLREKGFLISPLDDLFKNSTHFRSIMLVHLNWFENLDESSNRAMWKSFLRKIVALLAIKASGKKLVWTMHNRLSHEKRSGKLSNRIVQLLLKAADAVVIHCAETESVLRETYPDFRGKILHIPHPHFIGLYGQIREPSANFAPLRLLFLGAVKPYKNLELLIRVCREFGNAIQLTIAGKPSTPEYGEELRRLAEGSESVDMRFGFVEDEQIPELIGNSDLLILPYDLRSSLNSGTVLLAFSYARTVICPRIGTIDELGAAESEVISYTYTTETEHELKLRDAIAAALELKKNNPTRLTQMGNAMKEHVMTANAPSLAIDALSELYWNLL